MTCRGSHHRWQSTRPSVATCSELRVQSTESKTTVSFCIASPSGGFCIIQYGATTFALPQCASILTSPTRDLTSNERNGAVDDDGGNDDVTSQVPCGLATIACRAVSRGHRGVRRTQEWHSKPQQPSSSRSSRRSRSTQVRSNSARIERNVCATGC